MLGCAAALAGDPSGADLIGKRAPALKVSNWIHSKPLDLEKLKGKVVLIRWWTAPDCPYCRATAPALNEFHRDFSTQGLQVLGVYHHKAASPLRVEEVEQWAKKYGFEFPVAIDQDWKTLKKWWLDAGGREWTSVTFLLDRQGVIRQIHPGGEYVKGDRDYLTLRRGIENLLKEKP